jgi:Big-like domain-containing protein
MPSKLATALITVPLLAAVGLALAAAGLVGAQQASAACPINDPDCGAGGATSTTYTNTLRVTKSAGTVSSTPSGINCGTTCTVDDSQTVPCSGGFCDDPDPNGWQTYTLTASGGPNGFSPNWTGCGSVASAACQVTLDQDRDVALAWLDTTDPVLNTLSVTNAAGKVGAVAQTSATASDNAGVARVEWFLGASLVATDTTAPYSATIDLSSVADGSQVTIGARATDTSNRTSVEKTVTLTVDRHVSMAIGSVPAVTNAASIPLTISTDADASMKCALSGAQTVAAAPCTGTYSPIGPDSPDGSYTYTVTATDAVGNTASANRSFVLDRTSPALSFTAGPTEGQLVGTPTVGFSFSEAEANPEALDCHLDGTAIACSPDVPLTLEGLTNGVHALTVQATDKAGNKTTITRNFAVSLPGSGDSGNAGSSLPGSSGSGNAGSSAATPGSPQVEPLVVSLKAPKQRALKKKKLVLNFTANQAFGVTAMVRLHGKTIAKFSQDVGSGKTTVKVPLGKKALAQLRKALHKQKTTKLVLKLTYTDAGGAEAPGSASIAIRR